MLGSLDVCGHTGCRKPLRPPLLQCARCKAVAYCSKECQTRAWKAGHKRECAPGDGKRAAQAGGSLRQQAAGVTANSSRMHLLAQILSLYEAQNWRGLITLEHKATGLAGDLRAAQPTNACLIYGMLGQAYDNLGQYRKASELLQKCTAIAEEIDRSKPLPPQPASRCEISPRSRRDRSEAPRQPPVRSGATLLVVPKPLMQHWREQMSWHLEQAALHGAVLVDSYGDGRRRRGALPPLREQWSISELANAAVVLTCNERLSYEQRLGASGRGAGSAEGRREAGISPLG